MTKQAVRIFKKEVIQYYQAAPYLETILQHISQGIIFVNSKGIITTYNNAAEELLNISSSDAFLQPFLSLFSDESFGFSLQMALKSKQNRKISLIKWDSIYHGTIEIEVESLYVKADVKSPFFRLLNLDYKDGVLILLRNITEINRLQKIASQHSRLQDLGEMAARVAHEIRNPLGSIIGFAGLLQQDLVAQPELQKIARYICEGTENLNQIVSHILTYSRTIESHPVESDLILLIHELMEQIQTDALFHCSIEYLFESNEKTFPILIDPSLIRSALFNLIINALESMPEGGLLTIRCKKGSKKAILSITDTGSGILPENLEKIFLPFFTTKSSGNGLGLSEVHKVIQAQNGTIDIESKVGIGTTFTINIPFLG
jgi:signal transduction histidine kinase